ncbi:LysM peptidoglycan-binding domain-containing protein [Aquibacillus rhizosphaerae]|uniref:LysM peptidoglycan-binding domain-containing protein n=1 Tax=Aquibacillus rhizosphaerae TaxID=3051431 RepID=A0ABT7L6D0_9BACI|nr:LysM peptidoglycan-binding domain-containing protein [Aquibacillus sp. LR5S19]MDL4840770.1 LysM peptidoglycan-binding domain-containing protein [Aquibacillus sp. LR5S19]
MSEDKFKDQAYDLRNMMNQINDSSESEPNTSSSLNEEMESDEHVNVLNLPPRSQTHANNKTKTKWKISFPLIRFLFVLFLLIVGLVLTFTFWGNKEIFSSSTPNVSDTTIAGELVKIGSQKQKTLEAVSSQVEEEVDTETIKQQESFDNDIEYYEVKAGDTLKSIAMNYYGSESGIELIVKENDLKDRNIRIGQSLVIPDEK